MCAHGIGQSVFTISNLSLKLAHPLEYEPRMSEGMVSKHMSRIHQAASYIRASLHILSNQEESGANIVPRQNF